MTNSTATVHFARVLPPMRRLVALDPGHRRVKMMLLHSEFGRWRILRQELIDLQADGMLSPEETRAQIRSLLVEWGHPPLAMAIPQHTAISQILDLPVTPEEEVEQLIADEAVKLGGVTESRIVYDFVQSDSATKDRQHFWVTLCQENEIRDRILKLGVDREDICEITTTANALIAAFNQARPNCRTAILVHAGAQSTVLVLVSAGQGTYATSFQMGGDFITRSLARLLRESEETAESVKRSKNLLSGEDALVEFRGVMDGWVAELNRQLAECVQHAPGGVRNLEDFELYHSGAAFEQPGLLDFIIEATGLKIQQWPESKAGWSGFTPLKGFEVAFGIGLTALGQSPQPVSLLPEDYRRGWKKRVIRQRIEMASLALAFACAILLIFGTWQKTTVIAKKEALLTKVVAAQEAFDANNALRQELALEYESLRPVLARYKNTGDLLTTFSLLQLAKSNQTFWYVLMADQQSYFSFPPAGVTTNRVAPTNLIGPVVPTFIGPVFPAPVTATNGPLARPGLIAEICVPGEAEASRRVLSELVNTLKQEKMFAKADLLSEDLRRNLADTKVVVPDRYFALALDFAESEVYQPLPLGRLPTTQPPVNRNAGRPRSAWTGAGDKGRQSAKRSNLDGFVPGI